MALMDATSLQDVLVKVGVFVLVQALVYIILSKSSDVFSTDKKTKKSLGIRPVRSVSIRRFIAALSDMPSGGEPSPSPRSAPALIHGDKHADDCSN